MSVVTATLLSQSTVIAENNYELVSVDIRREVNRIARATLVFLDGDATIGVFALSNKEDFQPGKEIEVKLRYEGKTEDATVFKGLVMRHSVEANAQTSQLSLELKDAAVKLTQTRKSAVFVDQDDAEIIGKLLKDAELKVGVLDPTQPKHAQIVQYYCTDWDFMVSRAEAQGLLVVTEDGEVSVRKVDLTAKPKRVFKYGINDIYDLEFSLDGGEQCSEVNSSAWDVKQNKMTDPPTDAKNFDLKQGDLKGAEIAETVGFQPHQLSHPAPLAPEELQGWADGQLMRSRLAMIRGRIEVPGFADIKLFDTIEIAGIGKRFNGRTIVTGICHRVDLNGWRTDVQFGLSARSFALEEGIQDVPAAGLLPGISGLHIAIVDTFEEDPEKQFRVKVIVPGVDEKTGSLWARLAAPDAGKNRGWFFRPETGDEVVVGFFNDDPRQPVILGSLFSPKNTPPENASEISQENTTKALVSKTGSMIGFIDDEKGSIFIKTAAGARILIDDSAKTLEFLDQNGNEFKMDDSGISIKTAKDLKLEATGNLEIKGAKVDMK
ncbi:MAG: Rhs element Vgr protein [Halioglobus sp.]|jgi:Rhs element Vgr protein